MAAMLPGTLFPAAVARATVEAGPVRQWLPHPKASSLTPRLWVLPPVVAEVAETLFPLTYSIPILPLKAGQNGGEKSGTAQLRILSAHQIRISSPTHLPPKAQNTGHS